MRSMSGEPGVAPAAEALATALRALGLEGDPEMVGTPQAVAELLAGFRPGPLPTCRPLPTRSQELIVLRELPFHSLCAHHLLPFFGQATIAYLPQDRIAGLGWFPRLLDALARRPQLQERLAAQVGEAIVEALEPRAVGVRLVARQMCVEMRGARSGGQFEVIWQSPGADERISRALR